MFCTILYLLVLKSLRPTMPTTRSAQRTLDIGWPSVTASSTVAPYLAPPTASCNLPTATKFSGKAGSCAPKKKDPRRQRDPNRPPRPLNAFFLYRRKFQKVVRRVVPDHRDVSKIIGQRWRLLDETEKKYWKVKAEEAKVLHADLYPEYRYRPVRGREKATRKNKEPGPEKIKRLQKVVQLLGDVEDGDELVLAVKKMDIGGSSSTSPGPNSPWSQASEAESADYNHLSNAPTVNGLAFRSPLFPPVEIVENSEAMFVPLFSLDPSSDLHAHANTMSLENSWGNLPESLLDYDMEPQFNALVDVNDGSDFADLLQAFDENSFGEQQNGCFDFTPSLDMGDATVMGTPSYGLSSDFISPASLPLDQAMLYSDWFTGASCLSEETANNSFPESFQPDGAMPAPIIFSSMTSRDSYDMALSSLEQALNLQPTPAAYALAI